MLRALRSWWRQALFVVVVLLIASCSGGGCSSGCSSCGVTPLAGGFPQGSTITNAASVRVTRPGLDFLQDNIAPLAQKLLATTAANGVVHFPIPTSSGVVTGGSYTICPAGPNSTTSPTQCIADINLAGANLTIDAVTSFTESDGGVLNEPGVLVSGTIPVRVQDLPAQFDFIGITVNPEIGVGTGNCTSGKPENNGSPGYDYYPFPITIFLPLVNETLTPRDGYTKIDTANAVINPQIAAAQIGICEDCTVVPIIGQPICDAIFGAITNALFGTLAGGITGELTSVLNGPLCTKADFSTTPPCPTGSSPDYGDAGPPDAAALASDGGDAGAAPSYNCVFNSAPTECVPIALGTEGQIDLGTLLSSISPGTTGSLDFVLASGGAMDPEPDEDAGANGHTPNGITLGMLGGALQAPQSDCVPVATNPMPTAIPIPDEMKGDTIPNWTADAGPDLGIAIDGRFLTYAFGNAYNSGVLCLGVSTEKFQQLNSGILSVLITSIKELTFEESAAPVAITTRPQKPPVVTLGAGTDVNKAPLLKIGLPSFAIDFYVWSSDRYIRAFTYTSDLTIPVNLSTGISKTNPNGGLLPQIGTLGIANGVVTNSTLLTDDPTAVASSLSSILSGIVGQVLGTGFSPINLSSALSSFGLTLDIPSGGIRMLTKGTDNYLAIFANLGTGTAAAIVETKAALVSKTVHPEAMQLSTATPATMPTIHVQLSSPQDDGTHAIEYSWRIDEGTWSGWSSANDLTIDDPILFFQAKHVLQAAARIAGQPATEDRTPAEVPFTIDVLAPFVRVIQPTPDTFAIDAWDVVSPKTALVARVRYTDSSGTVGEWSAWNALAATTLDPAMSAADVQVRDEEQNVASISANLIRGRGDPTLAASGGCSNGCTAGAASKTEWPAIALAFGAIALMFARRRRVSLRSNGVARAATAMLALGSLAAVAATSQGCSCGSSGQTAPPMTGCGSNCNQQCAAALSPGLIGEYTSIAKAADGTIWVAGYDDAEVDPNDGLTVIFGDLVVGKYDQGTSAVQWVTVDGLPPPATDGTCPDNDPTGWRGGVSDSGPDVGLWTSIVLDANGHPMVAYYDATNQALKFASSQDGVTWANHAVLANPGSDVGRYAKMLVDTNGNPVIAFSTLETGTTTGHTISKVSIAHANVALPAQPSDWTIEDALVDDDGPCLSAADCTTATQACLTTGTCVATVKGCTATCTTSQACVAAAADAGADAAPACTAIAQSTDLTTYPNGIGDYIAMQSAPGGLALVAYDRIHGNLNGITKASGSWVVTILDGEIGSRANGTAVDTGDDGIGASLFVAQNGDWHVSYVDGITEALKYLYVPGGKLAQGIAAQVVDTGLSVDGKPPFTDGLHIVGDDSSVRANSDGSIDITYQDATAGTLRLATGTTTPGTWTLHAVAPPSPLPLPDDAGLPLFAGFFPHFVPNDTSIANWWRVSDPTSQMEYGNVSIVPSQGASPAQ